MPQDTLKLPELSLVLLLGSMGAGKPTFARRLFRPTEIVSSDTCRGLVSGEESSRDAKRGRLTMVDATSVRAEDRKAFGALTR